MPFKSKQISLLNHNRFARGSKVVGTPPYLPGFSFGSVLIKDILFVLKTVPEIREILLIT